MQAKGLRELIVFAVFWSVFIAEFGSSLPSQTLKRINKYRKMACLAAVKTEGVVPDVIDQIPADIIEITYPSGAVVQPGKELTPTQVKDFPKFGYTAKDNKLYTLMMVDPDAPSRQDPKMREILHMLIGNIPGKEVSKGDTFAEYIGAGAPQGTGLHRYIFLLFEQKEKVISTMKTSNRSREGRVNFNTREFAKANKLGEPIAVNFFQAQFDDYVPTLHAQLASG